MDVQDYNLEQHIGVLFDGVGDVQMLFKNRESLQGRPKASKGGKSATGMYSFPYTFASRAVIATFDLGAKNLHMFETNHWLSNPKNVIVCRLTEKAFIEPVESPVGAESNVQGVPASASRAAPQKRSRTWVSSPLRNSGISEEELASAMPVTGMSASSFGSAADVPGITAEELESAVPCRGNASYQQDVPRDLHLPFCQDGNHAQTGYVTPLKCSDVSSNQSGDRVWTSSAARIANSCAASQVSGHIGEFEPHVDFEVARVNLEECFFAQHGLTVEEYYTAEGAIAIDS